MRLKVSSAKWRPFCLGLNVLNDQHGEIQLNEASNLFMPRNLCVNPYGTETGIFRYKSVNIMALVHFIVRGPLF